MTWQCYGWSGSYCHVGKNFFASDRDGLCFDDPDMDYLPKQYPFSLYFAALNTPSVHRLNRKVVMYWNGEAFGTQEMENSWHHIWVAVDISGAQEEGLYTFELQDSDGTVLCSQSANIGEETPDTEPPEPAKEDYTDYTKIEDIIDDSTTLAKLNIINGINTVETSVGAVNTNVSNLIASGVTDIKTVVNTVSNNANSFTSYFKGLFNLEDGTYGLYLNDIKHAVDNISFPDLSGLSDSVDDLKDSIGNITFPDLSGLSNTLDSVKTSLENLDIPSLGQISQLTNKVATAVNDIYNSLYKDLVRERNNIFRYMDVGIANLKTDIINEIDDINIEIPDITFPDLSFITDGFNSVETIINGLDFPTLEGIKTEFENTASSIADKILERILDEIERRYNK